MKFIMSNSDDIRIDIENDFELAVEKLREVETEYTARAVDMSFGSGLTDEERKRYKVGEILSLYSRLGDSKYYYRFF